MESFLWIRINLEDLFVLTMNASLIHWNIFLLNILQLLLWHTHIQAHMLTCSTILCELSQKVIILVKQELHIPCKIYHIHFKIVWHNSYTKVLKTTKQYEKDRALQTLFISVNWVNPGQHYNRCLWKPHMPKKYSQRDSFQYSSSYLQDAKQHLSDTKKKAWQRDTLSQSPKFNYEIAIV